MDVEIDASSVSSGTDTNPSWDQFLRRVAIEASRIKKKVTRPTTVGHASLAIESLKQEMQQRNPLALAKSIEDSKKAIRLKSTLFISSIMSEIHQCRSTQMPNLNRFYDEEISALLEHTSTACSPFILFCALPIDLQKNTLHFMGLTSETTQQKFLRTSAIKAFEYYAVCQQRGGDLPIDLHFLLDTRKQVVFVARLLNNQYENRVLTEEEASQLPKLPDKLLEDPIYKEIAQKALTIPKETPQHNSSIVKTEKKTVVEESNTEASKNYTSSFLGINLLTTLLTTAIQCPSTDYIL